MIVLFIASSFRYRQTRAHRAQFTLDEIRSMLARTDRISSESPKLRCFVLTLTTHHAGAAPPPPHTFLPALIAARWRAESPSRLARRKVESEAVKARSPSGMTRT